MATKWPRTRLRYGPAGGLEGRPLPRPVVIGPLGDRHPGARRRLGWEKPAGVGAVTQPEPEATAEPLSETSASLNRSKRRKLRIPSTVQWRSQQARSSAGRRRRATAAGDAAGHGPDSELGRDEGGLVVCRSLCVPSRQPRPPTAVAFKSKRIQANRSNRDGSTSIQAHERQRQPTPNTELETGLPLGLKGALTCENS